MNKNKASAKITDCLTTLAAAALTALLILTEPFYALDAMLCDTVYSKMNGTGDEIVIIAIDEETLAEYGSISEWPRTLYAELTDKLFSDEENKPAVLAFDMLFTGKSTPENDDALLSSFSGRNIVTATNLVYRGAAVYSDEARYYDAWNISMEELPYEPLNGAVRTGFANTMISRDGFVRSAQLWTEYLGETRYSFAAQVFRQYAASNGEEAVFSKTNSYGQVLFDYSGKPGEFQHISMKDVLLGKIDAKVFAGRIVMVGAYAPGLRDAFRTPADRDRDMYGVEVNANIVRALMLGKTTRKAPAPIHAAAAALVVSIYVFSARRMKMYPAALSAVWVIIADIGVCFVLSRCGVTLSLIYPPIVAAAFSLGIFFEKYVAEVLRKKRVLQGFEKYLSPQVIKKLSKDEEYDFTLGVERREVCVLFVDIRGFTSMSEVLEPEKVAEILNEYLSEVTSCVFRHSGMLDKFIGDAAMAVFNAPTDLDDYHYKAICAGIDIKNCGEALGKRLLEKHGRTIGFGVGLNCGEAVVGNIGCDIRMDYTAIGDTVNTAARLEAKAEAGEVLISEELYQKTKDRIAAEFAEEMTLKGKTAPVKVYRVTGSKP